MAEHKIEDTNPPLARRAVRPFVGPAGSAAPGRPLLRPAGPAGRPSPAPFAPPPRAPGTMANAQPAAPTTDATASEPVVLVETPEPSQLTSLEPQSRRPMTSEMVALDAFAAFDAVWGGSTTPAESPVVEPVVEPVASLVDEASLGSGAGAHELWAEDITARDLDATYAGEESPGPAVGAEHDMPPSNALESVWPTITTPDSAIPAWLVDHDDPTDPAASSQPSPDLIVPDATDIGADQSDQAEDARVSHSLLVSAVLDRLAERVRGGEIDVSSVAPEAPDAAVLASVLAALLGGSSSR